MRTSLLRANPPGRIIHEQILQQIHPLLPNHLQRIRTNQLLLRLPLPLGKTTLEIRETRHPGPIRLGRRPQHAENLENLINLAIAREQRFPRRHLGENAADGPHVDAGAVLAATEQDFGAPVPERDDFVGVGAEGDAEGAGEAEVGEFEVAFFVDEEVLGFQVAVQDAVGVAVASAEEELVGEFFDLCVMATISA